MTPLTTILEILIILVLYWLGEFTIQTKWQSENKTVHFSALFAHSLNYTAVFCLPMLAFYFSSYMRPEVCFILPAAFLTHLGACYYTTKISEKLAAEAKINGPNSAYSYSGLGHIICIFQLLATYYLLQY